jgi:hypothetical protein
MSFSTNVTTGATYAENIHHDLIILQFFRPSGFALQSAQGGISEA